MEGKDIALTVGGIGFLGIVAWLILRQKTANAAVMQQVPIISTQGSMSTGTPNSIAAPMPPIFTPPSPVTTTDMASVTPTKTLFGIPVYNTHIASQPVQIIDHNAIYGGSTIGNRQSLHA